MPGAGLIETKLVRFDAEAGARDGVIEGYASVFGVTDQAGDVVAPDAFARSLAMRDAACVRMLWQHDPNAPIGVWERIGTDAHGLFARGRILGNVTRGREALSLLRAGAIDGLSIGFKTIRSRIDDRTGVRTLLEIDLWEISIVTFPMNEAARVAGVKQHPAALAPAYGKTEEDEELRELARAIRRASKAMQP